MRNTQDINDMIYNMQQKLNNLKIFIVHAEAELYEMSEFIMDIEEKELDKKLNEWYSTL